MTTNKTIIGPASCELFRQIAERLRYSDIEVICTDAELSEFLDTAESKRARCIFYEAENENVETLALITRALPSEPLLVLIAKEDTDISRFKNSDRSGIIRLPANPENLVTMLLHYLRDKKAVNEEQKNELIDSHISHVLVNSCITPHCRGFHYLRDVFKIILKKECQASSIRSTVYSEVAEKWNTTVGAVDHAIRIAIKKSWEDTSSNFRVKYFGVLGMRLIKMPTPKEYIFTIAEGLRRELDSKLLG